MPDPTQGGEEPMDALIERSSLGTEGAKALRRRTPPEVVDEIVRQSIALSEQTDEGDITAMLRERIVDVLARFDGWDSFAEARDFTREHQRMADAVLDALGLEQVGWGVRYVPLVRPAFWSFVRDDSPNTVPLYRLAGPVGEDRDG